MVVWFGRGATDLDTLKTTVAVTGLFLNAGIAGMYLLFAKVFPTHVRATGTGFAIGLGRGGAVLAPVIAGYLFHAGLSLQTVALCMASGSLLAAAAPAHAQGARRSVRRAPHLDLSYSPRPGL